jgi:hypothetical protein
MTALTIYILVNPGRIGFLSRISLTLRSIVSVKTSVRSLRSGNRYDITVRATRLASTINSGSVVYKNGSDSIPQKASSVICLPKTLLIALQQKRAANVVEPSMLSHIDSSSLQACVFTVSDFCLSQLSIARLTNSEASSVIRSASTSLVLIRLRQIATKSFPFLGIKTS